MTTERDGHEVEETDESKWVLMATRVPQSTRDRFRRLASRLPGEFMKDHINKALHQYLAKVEDGKDR